MLLKTRLFILAGFLLMLSYGIALAVNDGISVNDSVDRANALVGDRIKFTVEIKYAPELK